MFLSNFVHLSLRCQFKKWFRLLFCYLANDVDTTYWLRWNFNEHHATFNYLVESLFWKTSYFFSSRYIANFWLALLTGKPFFPLLLPATLLALNVRIYSLAPLKKIEYSKSWVGVNVSRCKRILLGYRL